MKFPEKLAKLLAERGVSQSRLARDSGISQSAISDMTAGKRRPYADQVVLLARELRVTADYLADDGDHREPNDVDLEMDARKVIGLIGWAEAYARLVGAAGEEDISRRAVIREAGEKERRGAG